MNSPPSPPSSCPRITSTSDTTEESLLLPFNSELGSCNKGTARDPDAANAEIAYPALTGKGSKLLVARIVSEKRSLSSGHSPLTLGGRGDSVVVEKPAPMPN